MIIAYDKEGNEEYMQKNFIGGVHVADKGAKENYIADIRQLQQGAVIPLFITTDMEGCINPFETFRHFPSLKTIGNEEDAHKIGREQGKLLKEIGFNMNFAPVVDLEDIIWKCRCFSGTPNEISGKATAYIKGLQEEGIIATAKHYPGNTLVIKDPHINKVIAVITDKDIFPFNEAIKTNVSAIMVSHLVVRGLANSNKMPASVSPSVIGHLKNDFTGLVVTDDIMMHSLKIYYPNFDELYINLVEAGNDLILNFNTKPEKIDHMINVLENAIKNGRISEDRIDASIIKILNAKGINVIKTDSSSGIPIPVMYPAKELI